MNGGCSMLHKENQLSADEIKRLADYILILRDIDKRLKPKKM